VFDGFEALQALCGDDGDRRHGWDFVRGLAAAFGRPLTEGDGVDPAEMAKAESRLGIALPAALREAYLLFGRCADLTASQDQLLAPERLQADADGVLVFRVENQYCASWGVRLEAMSSDDPPVLLTVGDEWMPYADRLSLALVEMVLSEAMFSARDGRSDNRNLGHVDQAELAVAFERLPLPDFPFWAIPDCPPVRWFAGPDVLLRDDGGEWLWVHGRTPEAVQAVRDRFPGEWELGPDLSIERSCSDRVP
jgi:hypothetical protein